jgi:hypothetical protein
LEQRFDCKLRGCRLPGHCRLFLRGKTSSNTAAPGEDLLASIGAIEDARSYQFLERSAFSNARRLRTGYCDKVPPAFPPFCLFKDASRPD